MEWLFLLRELNGPVYTNDWKCEWGFFWRLFYCLDLLLVGLVIDDRGVVTEINKLFFLFHAHFWLVSLFVQDTEEPLFLSQNECSPWEKKSSGLMDS